MKVCANDIKEKLRIVGNKIFFIGVIISNRVKSKRDVLGHLRLMRARKGKGEIFVVSWLPNDGNFKVPRAASVDAIFCFNAAIILIPFRDCSVNLR